MHAFAGAGVLALLNGIALGVAAILFIDYARERGPVKSDIPKQSEPSAEVRTELAQRFAPILQYDSRELFVPISRGAYVGRTQLKEQEGRFFRLLNAIPKEDTLPVVEGTCIRARGCVYMLDVRGVEPDPPKQSQPAYGAIQRRLLRGGERPTVYAHVTQYEDSGDYAVQYWFLYLFNFRLNEHESDWEQITVRLNEDKEPQDAYFSAHEGGNVRPWLEVEKRGDHPVDYAALGSHANYFERGRHPVKVGCRRVIGSIKSCLRGRRVLVDVNNAAGRILRPGQYAIVELTGRPYIGSYGTGNYVVLTRKPDVLNDPRRRTLWRDPLRPLR
ncbi:MAG TPA: Vps62-related protein [Gaiellaceae bacterium]|nr:Vps62-related protein [Gaiellaceae bacterium]